MGDYEQFRDYRLLPLSVSPTPIPVHMGGFVDVYCKTTLREKVIRFTTDAQGNVFSNFGQPLVYISLPSAGEKAVENDDGSPVQTQDPTLVISDLNDLRIEDLQYTSPIGVPQEEETGFSTKQRVKVSSAGIAFAANATFDVKVLYWDSIDSVQNYLSDP